MAAVKDLSRLEEVELREIWPTEHQHFTPWLAKEENLTLLGKTLGLQLEDGRQKVKVGSFEADILCQNPDNPENEMRVLIENQLEEADHKHLGQILTYAAGLDAYTIIWIAKKFKDEHRAALDRLNEITDEHFHYFGIEIKVWQIGDSDPAPQFEIVSSPNNWRREVSHDTQQVVNTDLNKTQQLRKKFWTGLRDYMIQKESLVKCRKPPSTNHFDFNIGISNDKFKMVAYLVRTKEIGVRLRTQGQDATAHFHLLKEQQADIEKEFSEPLEWEELPESKSSLISLRQENTDPTNETDWPNQHKWLASKLELFDKVFRPRVKVLNAADWEPPGDENDE